MNVFEARYFEEDLGLLPVGTADPIIDDAKNQQTRELYFAISVLSEALEKLKCEYYTLTKEEQL